MSEQAPHLYTVLVKRSAEKELAQLSGKLRERIESAILALERQPRPPGYKKLQNSSALRLRVGDYRVLYLIDDRARTCEVISIGNRRDVYRDL